MHGKSHKKSKQSSIKSRSCYERSKSKAANEQFKVYGDDMKEEHGYKRAIGHTGCMAMLRVKSMCYERPIGYIRSMVMLRIKSMRYR